MKEEFLPSHYRAIADIIYREAGIQLGTNKMTLVESRLLKRRASLGLKTWPEYHEHLKRRAADELPFLIEALTTHKTDWFREPEHYDYLASLSAKSPGKNLLIWSAACSTGEEAGSAALTLIRSGRPASKFRILGTDISQDVVNKASRGLYSADLIEPGQILADSQNYFARTGPKQIQLVPELRQGIKFRPLNLMTPKLPADLQFDLIFLRNVLIYFDLESTRVVIANVLQHLRPGGVLILGLSEALRVETPTLLRQGKSIYVHAA